jgi:hypothetical protein
MERVETIPLPIPPDNFDLEANPREPEVRDGQTVVLADLHAKESGDADSNNSDTGNTVLTQLDNLRALVQEEAAREMRGTHGPARESVSEGPEEALDDYMKQFMERLTGKKPVAAAQPVQTAESLPTVQPLVEVRQPARAPEDSASLDRMRDVANANSRGALEIHRYRQCSSRIVASFLPAAAASLASTAMAVIGAANGSIWCQTGALGLLAVALTFAGRFWMLRRKLGQGAI